MAFLICRSVQDDDGKFRTGAVGAQKTPQNANHIASKVVAEYGYDIKTVQGFEDGTVIREGVDPEGRAVDVFTVSLDELITIQKTGESPLQP